MQLVAGVLAAVRREVGAVASMKQAAVVARLPKTRSGKTLRGTMKVGERVRGPANCALLSVITRLHRFDFPGPSRSATGTVDCCATSASQAIADGTPYKAPATIDDPAVLGEVEVALRGLGYARAR